jgi:replicative DNA helicase
MSDTQVIFDTQLERVILGAILLEKTAIARVAPLFKPEMFYVGQNEVVAETILRLFKSATPIDLATVWIDLKKSGKQSAISLGELSSYTMDVVSSANLEEHMLKLTEMFMSRELQKISGKAYGRAGNWSEDVFDLVNDLQRELTNLLAGTMQGGLIGVDKLIINTLKYIELIRPELISGVATGIDLIDNIFYGFKEQELHILAARPSCGKTALALQIRRHAAKTGKRMALFTLEMSANKILQRDLAAESGVAFAKIQRNHLEPFEWNLLNDAASRLAKLPMSIDDSFTQSVQVLHSKCIQEKFRNGLDGVVVDYLQLIGGNKTTKGQNREQVIAEISRGLKGMAKDLNVPVIALSQMSRGVETRGSKDPQLSDLRESGAIEQDADGVIFLTPEDEEQETFGGPRNIKVKIAKNRDGARNTFILQFEGNYMRFSSPAPDLPKSTGLWYPVHNSIEDNKEPF